MVRLAHRTALAVTVVAAAVSAVAGAASPAAPSVRGKLVLVGESLNSIDYGENGLYVMNTDGSGLRQITHSASDTQPRWSPDGRWIAFVHDDDASDTQVVIVRNADSGRRRVLGTTGVGDMDAPNPWSPDGKRIAWSGCGGLCVFDLKSSHRTEISLGGDDDNAYSFSWSPDGRELVAVDGDQSRRLVVVDAAGGIVRILPAAGDDPAWSPEGREIAFVTDETNKLELASPTGGPPRVVARRAGSPSWSPDGHRLLYTDFDRSNGSSSVRVVNVVTHTNTRIDGSSYGIARWSPDGSMIAYGRSPVGSGIGEDVWIADAAGGSLRQLTGEFPTGLGYSDLDWASGSVAAGPPAAPPDLLQLTATGELKLDDAVVSFGRAATPGSVVYRTDLLCSYDAETTSASFNVWTPATGQTATTSTDCQDWEPGSYAVTASLAAWTSQIDLNDDETLTVVRTDTTATPASASWTTGEDAPDIGWQDELGGVVSDGSLILFDTGKQLWRIADSGTALHAVPVPGPSDATGLIDADAGRIVVGIGRSSLAVLNTDGAVLSRLPVPAGATVALGGNLLAVAAGTRLRVYDADSGALNYQLPLSRTTGVPQLLTVGAGYAVYASGIELHLLRLANGNDRIVDLPGQDGPLQALLTTEGLFLAYDQGYDPQPGRILFVPAANLP